MKIGGIEGTPEEIRDFCTNNGLDIEDYLVKTEQPLSRIYVITPALLYACLVLATFLLNKSEGWQLTAFFLGCLSALWLTVCVQIRFKNHGATACVIIVGIAILLAALGVISPRELLDQAKGLKP